MFVFIKKGNKAETCYTRKASFSQADNNKRKSFFPVYYLVCFGYYHENGLNSFCEAHENGNAMKDSCILEFLARVRALINHALVFGFLQFDFKTTNFQKRF